MRKYRTTIVLQRTKQRIGIDLIAGTSQVTAAIIAAQIVAMRGNRAAVIEDVSARTARVQDGIAEFQRGAAAAVTVVNAAAADAGRVAAKGAIAYGHPRDDAAVRAPIVDAAAVVGRVAANSAVAYGYYRATQFSAPTRDAAAAGVFGRVAADSAVGDREGRAAVVGEVGDAAAVIAADDAIVHAQLRSAEPGAVVEDTAAVVASDSAVAHCQPTV